MGRLESTEHRAPLIQELTKIGGWYRTCNRHAHERQYEFVTFKVPSGGAEAAGRKMMESTQSRTASCSITGWVGCPIRWLHICADGNDCEVKFNAESRGKSGYNRSKSHVDL
jgi:hypothetical protein